MFGASGEGKQETLAARAWPLQAGARGTREEDSQSWSPGVQVIITPETTGGWTELVTRRRWDSPVTRGDGEQGPLATPPCASVTQSSRVTAGLAPGSFRENAALLIRNEILGTEGRLQTEPGCSPSVRQAAVGGCVCRLISCVITSFLH